MAVVSYSFVCPNCGQNKEVMLEISDKDAAAIDEGTMSLKEATEPGTFQREIFISGMCYDCQEKLFNRPAPGHEAEWGEQKDECPECGCPLYQLDIDRDECPTCHSRISAIMDEEQEGDSQVWQNIGSCLQETCTKG